LQKLSIIIPVYNEEKTVLQLIDKVKCVELINSIKKEIVIVDDHSTDNTRRLLESVQDCKVILLENNRGKGYAIRSGLKHITGDYVIIQDADLEYDPEDYNDLIEQVLLNDADAVFGSRRLKKSNKKYSGFSFYLGGILVTWFTNILYGTAITDEPTCYKLINSNTLKSFNLECEGFEFCPEVTAKLAKNNIPIYEVPINYYPRHINEGKKINWKDGVIAIKTLLKYKFIK
jgi:glycosyltransferase involved in cell wall biosynthesis